MTASTIDGSTGLVVAYNALAVRPGVYDGGATYSINVLRYLPALLPDARIVALCRPGEDRIAPAGNLELRRLDVRSAVSRAFAESFGLGRLLAELGADVFVSPHESLPLGLRPRAVVVAQNLAYHCSLGPRAFHGGSVADRIASFLQRTYYRRRMLQAYRRADVIVAISRTAAELLAERAGLPLERTIVAHGGGDSVFLTAPVAEESRAARVLVVSAVAPYKNFSAALDALALLRRSHPDVELAVAGGDWRGYRAVVEAYARAAGVEDAVRFLGPQPPEAVARLYASSAVLLHLSECEACPLPPLEAMAAGLPVVAARRSSIPEVVGDAGVLVEPTEPAVVAAAIASVFDPGPERDALVRRGRRRAATLTWRATAEGIAEAVRRAASL